MNMRGEALMRAGSPYAAEQVGLPAVRDAKASLRLNRRAMPCPDLFAPA
jgi:hypothetical protein